MRSPRSYLVRALIDWIVDSGCTPQIVISNIVDGVRVPQEYVRDGFVTLNVSATAVQNFSIDDDTVSFSARFDGVPHEVSAPVGAIVGVFAGENGAGMGFDAESKNVENLPSRQAAKPAAGKRPQFRLVK